MYVCVYVCMHVHVEGGMIASHVQRHGLKCMCVCVYVCMHVHVEEGIITSYVQCHEFVRMQHFIACVCVCVCMCVCVCVCVCACVCVVLVEVNYLNPMKHVYMLHDTCMHAHMLGLPISSPSECHSIHEVH
jgi:hypothetical protein